MRFLANENFPRASIRRLREAGYDVEAVQEKEPGAKDPAVLDYAARENLVLLTFDRDYGELIYRRHLPSPRGVLYLRLIPLTGFNLGRGRSGVAGGPVRPAVPRCRRALPSR